MYRPSYYLKATVFCILLLTVLGHANCSSAGRKPFQEVKFIVLGNTGPASPFTGFSAKLSSVYKSINHENIVLVIHLGNMVHGGHDWMGITKIDVERQYRMAFMHNKSLTPILHMVAGEMDKYNGTTELFEHFISKKLFYSFNYADSHFILLNITNKDHALSPEQKKWLNEDLEIYKKSPAIFVFSHYPITSSQQSGIRYQDGEELHALFARYPVRAVISGGAKTFLDFERDAIRYIVAGCYGYNDENWHSKYNQYYIAHYDGFNFTIKGVKMNFQGTLKPKISRD
jgi:hypothetical protein